MKVLEFLKGMWELMPFSFFIGLITRIILVTTSLSYLSSIGTESSLISIIMISWALMPVYYSVRNFYYSSWGCQNKYTSLWNMLESIRILDKASKKRIEATKLRIWVERNPEIHLFNYWFLKYLRRKEWKDINIDDYDKLPSNKHSQKNTDKEANRK